MSVPPVIHLIDCGPIIAEITQAIDGAALMRLRFGDVLIVTMPAELGEDLVDGVLEASADDAASYVPAR